MLILLKEFNKKMAVDLIAEYLISLCLLFNISSAVHSLKT